MLSAEICEGSGWLEPSKGRGKSMAAATLEQLDAAMWLVEWHEQGGEVQSLQRGKGV